MVSIERLAEAYARCRQLHRFHGRTYYLATLLLPTWKRRHVHALYGFTRHADDLVDRLDGTPVEVRAAQLAGWGAALAEGLRGGEVTDPLLPAVIHTTRIFGLRESDFELFLRSMAMDLTVTEYKTYEDLLDYMAGSAAVIGTLMLPILGSPDPAAAREPARQLGLAFQLTNFIRDIGEDLGRDRLYLPLADLELFGVARADLVSAAAGGSLTAGVRNLIAYECERARAHYELADPGIELLARSSRATIRAARHMYAGILDEVRAADYDVFSHRLRVSTPRRLSIAVRQLLHV